MNDKLQMNTRVRRLFHYIDDFQKGIIRVPAFQREFVWKMKDKLELFDSIKKGFPIGSILLWRPGEETDGDFFRFEAETIGSYTIPKRSTDYFFILDGYQRISTLFGCLVNPLETFLKRDDTKWLQEYNLIYDLKDDKFEYNKSKKQLDDLEIYKVPLYKFVDSKEFFSFQKKLYKADLNEEEIERYILNYESLSSRLVDYSLPSIDIIGGTAAQAVDIFSRVNSTGVSLADDWKISALSYNPSRHFRLGSEIDDLLRELTEFNFGTIKRNLILQCIVNSFGRVFFDQNSKMLEELALRSDFIDITRTTILSIKKAVKFLFEELSVLDVKLLPYNNQLIFITEYFTKTQNPSEESLQILKKWFWITSYSGYFTLHNLSKQRLAYNQFQSFIAGETDDPLYLDKPSKKFIVTPFPARITMGSVRAKSLVLLMLNTLKAAQPSKNDIVRFKILPLFKTLDKEIDISAENQVVIIQHEHQNILIPKELSQWLNSTTDLAPYFITIGMKLAYQANAKVIPILSSRKTYVKKVEKEFVESLNLIYED